MDREIEQQTQKSIPEIFADEGEAYFRSLERALVKKLAAQEGQIISTGGALSCSLKTYQTLKKQVWSAAYAQPDRLPTTPRTRYITPLIKR